MAELNVEEFNALPEKVKTDYEKVGEVYRPALEGKVTTLKQSLDGLDVKLRNFQSQEAAKIEAARVAALEEAKTKGDVSTAEKLYKEQMADLTARMEKLQKDSDERIAKMSENAKKDKKAAVKAQIIAQYGTEDGADAMDSLLDPLISYDPETGKEIFYNLDGSASSLDRNGFIKEMLKMKRFKTVLKADINTGGQAKGNNNGDSGGADKTLTKLSPTERITKARAEKAKKP